MEKRCEEEIDNGLVYQCGRHYGHKGKHATCVGWTYQVIEWGDASAESIQQEDNPSTGPEDGWKVIQDTPETVGYFASHLVDLDKK